MIPKNILPATLLLMALLTGWPSARSLAQTTGTPGSVQEAFKRKYPRAGEVNWAKVDSLYVASFLMDRYYADAFFRKDGTWLESTTYIDQQELPDPVRQIIAARFPGVEIYDSVTRTETLSGISYQISLDYQEKTVFLNLDPAGKILGEKANNRM